MSVRPLGVCSWSLLPSTPGELADRLRACGVSRVQLALDPLREGRWREDETLGVLRAAGAEVVSGMIAMKGEDYTTLESIRRTGGVGPDVHWGENFRAAEANAALAQRLGLALVTFHAGFVPARGTFEYRTMLDRVRQLAQLHAGRGVRLALETGQERAEVLEALLEELNGGLPRRWHVGVNFDPANIVLYGLGEPLAALRLLRPYVRQMHLKDAVPSRKPGVWGTEVVVGTGAVPWRDVFELMDGHDVELVIERETGRDRVEDIRTAKAYIDTIRGVAS